MYPGYFVSLTAGIWPSLAKSVVLMNTAGSVIPGYTLRPLEDVSETCVLLRTFSFVICPDIFPQYILVRQVVSNNETANSYQIVVIESNRCFFFEKREGNQIAVLLPLLMQAFQSAIIEPLIDLIINHVLQSIASLIDSMIGNCRSDHSILVDYYTLLIDQFSDND